MLARSLVVSMWRAEAGGLAHVQATAPSATAVEHSTVAPAATALQTHVAAALALLPAAVSSSME